MALPETIDDVSRAFSASDVPFGFHARTNGACTLLVREDLEDELVEQGLAGAGGWEERLLAAAAGPGRGATARLTMRRGPRLVLKRMRRGGLLASLWRDRFAGSQRLLANLTVPGEAIRRGVATAAPAALLIREGPAGLFEGWLATEEIEGASDLRTRLSRSPEPPREALSTAMALVRRAHDAGVEHRDLNLGNILVREHAGWQAFLVDLDGARLRPAPLPFRARRSALRRIQRSYEKRFGPAGPLGQGGSVLWYDLYAADDPDLRRRLREGIGASRLWIALHRLGWNGHAGSS